MRKFLSRTAGAIFNEEMPGVTFSVKKSWIEIIFKIEPHIFTIINMVAVGDDKAFLFANWTDFLCCIENEEDTMEKVKKICPSVYSAYQSYSPDGIRAKAIHRDNGFRAGYVKEVDIKKDTPVFLCIDKDIVEAAETLSDRCLDMYREIYKNPPYPEWRDLLRNLWN